jgi:plasmid stability protein
MRTTLNLDDDVAAQLAEESRRRGRSLSRTANELLRAGMRTEGNEVDLEAYDPPVFDTGRVLVDVTDVAAALELLDRGG